LRERDLKFSTLIIILVILFTRFSFAEENFVKTYYDKNRNFYVTGPAEGEWIESAHFQVFVFKEATQACELTPEQVQYHLTQSIDSSFWKILNHYYPDAEKEFLELHLKISVDSFGDRNKTLDFGSFFLPNTPNPDEELIVLECRFFKDGYWKAFLGHELIHALMAAHALQTSGPSSEAFVQKTSKGISSWIEELLAQNVEYEISHRFPILRIQQLAQQVLVPSPISQQRPFQNSAMYANNFLLGQYLLNRWGGLNTLRALLPQVEIKECLHDLTDSAILCRIQQSLKNMNATRELQERSTLPGLLRHFAIALVLNKMESSSQGLYSIPGWQGFTSRPLNETDTNWNFKKVILEKGAFLRLSPQLWVRHQKQWNPQLETYRILVYKDGSYELRDSTQFQNKILNSIKYDTVILLNTTSENLFL
jgi:hypothetical protein